MAGPCGPCGACARFPRRFACATARGAAEQPPFPPFCDEARRDGAEDDAGEGDGGHARDKVGGASGSSGPGGPGGLPAAPPTSGL
eukprot:gene13939-biopygen1475